MFKRAWLAGLAGVFAISAGVSAAKAESYTLTVIEASCGGNSATCTPDNPISRRRARGLHGHLEFHPGWWWP